LNLNAYGVMMEFFNFGLKKSEGTRARYVGVRLESSGGDHPVVIPPWGVLFNLGHPSLDR
jgi:hypothetical protein